MSPLPSSSRRRSIGSERAEWDAGQCTRAADRASGRAVSSARMATPRRVGILTAGGDSPGLNAAIRGVRQGRDRHLRHGGHRLPRRLPRAWRRTARSGSTSGRWPGILTIGGTILGTSRDKPHRMLVGGEILDMTDAIVEIYRKDAPRRARLPGRRRHAEERAAPGRAGLNVITLPKTIDNDVAGTDATFGFATALDIATEAIDRLHSTAHSHHRIIVAEIMGHRAGWLTLGAGLAGGADVILIPEIPYTVATHRRGHPATASARARNFSIVAVAEGARNADDAARRLAAAEARAARGKDPAAKEAAAAEVRLLEVQHHGQHAAAGAPAGGS